MTDTFIKTVGLILFAFVFLYGLYISIASLLNWEKFIRGYKRIDLVKIFGDFGRVLYFILGILISIVSTLMFLKLIGIGPWVGLK